MCYSAMIERELAEERERIHQRKIHHLKSKASEAIVAMQHANTNANITNTDIPDNVAMEEETETDAHVKMKIIDAEADDHDDEEKENLEAHAMTQRAAEAATEELREKLALAFGRVIVACDRLPHVLAPMGVTDQAAAVTNVSAFLIAHSGKWLRQGQTEPMRVKETREAEDVDEIDSARRKLKAEEEKAEMERRMEERRARKMAMVALARQKKETRVEEIRKQQQQKKSNDELDAKAYEDPRGQSELTVA
jgi:hypothetical protein